MKARVRRYIDLMSSATSVRRTDGDWDAGWGPQGDGAEALAGAALRCNEKLRVGTRPCIKRRLATP